MAATRAVYVGGVGSTLTADDVAAIAAGAPVQVDSTALDRLKKESPPPKAFTALTSLADVAPGTTDGSAPACLDAHHARAAVLIKLLELLQGKTKARPALATYLGDILNESLVPLLPAASTDRDALHAIAASCFGLGDIAPQQSLEAALVSKQRHPPLLSAGEAAVMLAGRAPGTGMACCLLTDARTSLAAGIAITALAAEALQADVRVWTDTPHEQQSKAVAEVASQLQGLLEGSRQVNPKKNPTKAPCLARAAELLGAVEAAVTQLAAAVRGELIAAVTGDITTPTSPALPTALIAAAQALIPAAAAARTRTTLMMQRLQVGQGGVGVVGVLEGLGGAVAAGGAAAAGAVVEACGVLLNDTDDVPGLVPACAMHAALQAYQQATALEALTAVLLLRVQQGPAKPAQIEASPPVSGGKHKGGPVMSLAKGTQALRVFLEGGEEEEGSALSTRTLATPSTVTDALSNIQGALSPQGPTLKAQLIVLQRLVEANQARRKPKIPKGTRDLLPEQMTIRQMAFETIERVFKRHGAVSIDTPVFELRETLMGKYGEDSKLIYDLADQGGEILSLRYDLTVPFARYVALHGVTNIKRYHVGKVYRRDQPQLSRGRFREFYQCDFDIAGSYAPMVPDAECLAVLVEILSALPLGDFQVKINHRRLLDAMLDIAGVPPQKFRPICSAIDKLDKEPWEVVKHEMVVEKGLPEAVADVIGTFVVVRGAPREVLTTLTAVNHPFMQHEDAKAALQDMATLFDFLDTMGVLSRLSFDLSLARGLDYYTGVIYEAVLHGASVGSIAAGGRYDKLVGLFSGKDIPAVGVSIGIERVFSIMEERLQAQAQEINGMIRETETQVLVASIGNGLQGKRMEIAAQLWRAGFKAEFGYKPNPKMGDQLGHALKTGIPLLLLFGEDELARGEIKVKNLQKQTETVVSASDIVNAVKEALKQVDDGRVVATTKQ